MTQNEAVNKMRGEPGTVVNITIRREGIEELLEFEIVREDIQIPSVEWEMKTDKIGYISVASFVNGVEIRSIQPLVNLPVKEQNI